jgi:hypothetical protein
LILDFARRFDVQTDIELPSGTRSERILRFENPSQSSARAITTLLVRIAPHESPSWLGEFAGYFPEPPGITAVASCPDELQICTICAGSGYVVQVNEPSQWESVPCIPVRDVLPIKPENLLLMYDFTSVVAYGRQGLRWRADDIVPDDLAIEGVVDGSVEISGWDPSTSTRIKVRLHAESGRQHSESP